MPNDDDRTDQRQGIPASVAGRMAIRNFRVLAEFERLLWEEPEFRSWLESRDLKREVVSHAKTFVNEFFPSGEFVAGAWLSANEVPEAAQYEERELALNEFFLDLCQRRSFQPTKAASVYVAPFLDDWRLCLTIYWTSDWKRYHYACSVATQFLNEHNLPSPKGIVQSTAGVLLVQSAADALGEQVAFPEPFVAILTGGTHVLTFDPLVVPAHSTPEEVDALVKNFLARCDAAFKRQLGYPLTPRKPHARSDPERDVLWLYRESVRGEARSEIAREAYCDPATVRDAVKATVDILARDGRTAPR